MFLLLALCFWFSPLFAGQNKRPPILLGYSASWYDSILPPEEYPWEALTHVARSFLVPTAKGELSVPDGFFDPRLYEQARRHNVKLLISLGGAAPSAEHWVALSENPRALEAFFRTLGRLVEENGYDGVDVDWEPSPLTDRETKAYSSFLKKLRGKFPKWIITTALGGGEYWAKHVEWDVVVENTDFVNLMSYVLSGAWGGQAAHFANLYPAAFQGEDGLSVDAVTRNLLENHGVPPSKLVLGLIFFGDQFFVEKLGDTFPANASGQGTEIAYRDVQRLLLTDLYGEKWDNRAKVPYLEKRGGGHVVSFDDARSIREKCRYAEKKNLAGVMVWNLGGDVWGEKTPLWDAVAQSFQKPVVRLPETALRRQLQEAENLLEKGARKKRLWAGELGDSNEASSKEEDLSEKRDLKKTWFEKEKKLARLQKELIALKSRLAEQGVRPGKKIGEEKESFLLDDFEDANFVTKTGTLWEAEGDTNNLGTLVEPLKIGKAGGARGRYLVFKGFYGKSIPPWPYAVLRMQLHPSGRADLSLFRAFRFQARGDGGDFDVQAVFAHVADYAHYRYSFKAEKGWKEVVAFFSEFAQPSWGEAVPAAFNAVEALQFSPAARSAQTFFLAVDTIELIP